MHALPDLEVQSKISRRNGAHFGSSRGSRPSAPRTWPRRRLVRQNCMPGRYFESFRPVGGKITLLRSRRGSLITAWLRFESFQLITVWLEVLVLPAPPRSPMQTDVSRSLTNGPQFAGISAGSNADVRSLPLAEVAIASIL